jgi:DNA adenine methylase
MKYVGSKNRLSKQIAPIIQSYIDNMPDCRGYLEPFVGGANMIDKIKCPCKIGNDVHKYLIAFAKPCIRDNRWFARYYHRGRI